MRKTLLLLVILPRLALPQEAEAPAPPEYRLPTVPTEGEVVLPAAGGWHASLILDNGGIGVWTVKSFKIFPELACPEVVGLDDKGVCHVFIPYSGRWTPLTCIHDGKWLGGLAHGDIDPRIDGEETYTGSQRGNLYQVVAYPHRTIDYRLIAHWDGLEVHTIVAGDLDPVRPGKEMLVFTRPGGLFLVTPTGPHGTFETARLDGVASRVRDAELIPGTRDIATVSVDGTVRLLRLGAKGPEWTDIHRDSMGAGRVALRPGEPLVLYTTHDDGRILRHERRAEGGWRSEPIYLGPLGPRGIAAGRFDADPATETVAIFGYSGKVELLSKRGDRWEVETLFQDRDKGHWLAAAEVDGRNATSELISAGYSGRIVLLARPPGYGVPGVTAEPQRGVTR